MPGEGKSVLQQATALRREGRLREADAVLAHRITVSDLSGPLVPYAETRRLLGDLETARTIIELALKRAPNNPAALLEQIEIALASGQMVEALALCDAALLLCPRHVTLALKRVAVLRQLGRVEAAEARLAALRVAFPAHENVRMAGFTAKSMPSYLAELQAALARLSDPAAPDALRDVLGLARVFEAHNAPFRAGVAIGPVLFSPQTDPKAWAASLVAAHGAAPILLLCALVPEPRARPAIAAVLEIAGQKSALSPQALDHFFRVAERLGDARSFERGAAMLRAHPRVGKALALRLLRMSMGFDETERTAELLVLLASKVPPLERYDFLLEACVLFKDPFEALKLARQSKPDRILPRHRLLHLRATLRAGQTELVYRYLRRCDDLWLRRTGWRDLWFESLIQSGRPDEAVTWIARNGPMLEPRVAHAMHRRALVQAERHDEARTLLEQGLNDTVCDLEDLRLLAFLGALVPARKALQDHLKNPQVSEQNKAHFSITHIGALLAELEVFHRAYPDAARTSPTPEMTARFVHAALRVVAGITPARLEAPPQRKDVPPKRILQYWDAPTPPEDVQRICQSWQDQPGWTYQRLDRLGAMKWLLADRGRPGLRAFQMANNPAEESDFLRLCILAREGGLYADADDLRVGSLDGLHRAASGLMLFRETMGPLANNFILAAPGHPILCRAADMAQKALLRRDNDIVWSKTGPGLLTRAVATCLLRDPALRERVQIIRQADYQRLVRIHMPTAHKSKSTYWNADHATEPIDPGFAAKALLTA